MTKQPKRARRAALARRVEEIANERIEESRAWLGLCLAWLRYCRLVAHLSEDSVAAIAPLRADLAACRETGDRLRDLPDTQLVAVASLLTALDHAAARRHADQAAAFGDSPALRAATLTTMLDRVWRPGHAAGQDSTNGRSASGHGHA
jgi:hypothetical protein